MDQIYFHTAILSGGDQSIRVWYADSDETRRHGLSSEKLKNLPVDGMLFRFDESEVQHFWMNKMKFDLDVLWIEGHEIVKIDLDIPAPAFGEEPAKMTSSPYEVNRVLELPAGGVEKWGFDIGDSIEYWFPESIDE